MSQLTFDEGLVTRLEALYRTRDVLRRRALVTEALGPRAGERLLDVGCGPGFYVAELLERVGPAGLVVGVDASAPMLTVAARRCAGRENVHFEQRDATSLALEDASFDGVVCVQVLEYVADVATALAELHRVVRPGGRVVVWDIDWATLSMHSADPARMARVLRAWDRHLAHPSLPRTLATGLRAAGFRDVAVAGHAFTSADFTPDAYGVSLLPLIERFVAGRDEVSAEEARAWADEQRALGDRGAFYSACVQLCFRAVRPG